MMKMNQEKIEQLEKEISNKSNNIKSMKLKVKSMANTLTNKLSNLRK